MFNLCEGDCQSSSSSSKEEDSDDSGLAVQKARSLPNLNRRLPKRTDSSDTTDGKDGYPSIDSNLQKARGYQRKVDRRRSQTFKSITVPEEVLQVAVDDEYQLPEDDDFDEYGEPLFAESWTALYALDCTKHKSASHHGIPLK
ncbi:unnamed protein product [Durusdinium trenchii]|uniref:Uncharacterized protein n=2 Tax=Durusdinium trenchii TaxID=1381693 RepID=A0ABP0KW24_9DINO